MAGQQNKKDIQRQIQMAEKNKKDKIRIIKNEKLDLETSLREYEKYKQEQKEKRE